MKRRSGKPRKPIQQPIMCEGVYQSHPKGFGFVVVEKDRETPDILIPRHRSSNALSGDRVQVRARRRGHKDGKPRLVGEIVEIVKRGRTDYVGTVVRDENGLSVQPDGRHFLPLIVLTDSPDISPGTKVVVQLSDYPTADSPPRGYVSEILGQAGQLGSETLAVERTHQLEEEFPKEVIAEAQSAAATLDQHIGQTSRAANREDLTSRVIVTIDPEGAKDFDDAISLEHRADGGYELGVHIADVSHFVAPGSLLDKEAFRRGTSVYLESRVVPMLPEILSNEVCSLRAGEPRLTKSVFIDYDRDANIVSTRFAESVIRSQARLTYAEAQDICDGKQRSVPKNISKIVRQMQTLAKQIEKRRQRRGMIQLDLPEIDLIYDKGGAVIDAQPCRNEYSHRIVEMFMVEANEAVCSLLDELGVAFLRRSHPSPSSDNLVQLRSYVRALGYSIANQPERSDIQDLLNKAADRPDIYALNLAVLKAQSQAEYSATASSHYALASDHYCHFTSPIRRYPDLEVHRHISLYCRGKKDRSSKKALAELKETAIHCCERERAAQTAENQLRQILILHHLSSDIGGEFDGIIVSLGEKGLFVQHPRFLVDGLVPYDSLGESSRDTSHQYGTVKLHASGKIYQVGDKLRVRISGVSIQKRHLDLQVPC